MRVVTIMLTLNAVSYTHLDVYKRQVYVLYCTNKCMYDIFVGEIYFWIISSPKLLCCLLALERVPSVVTYRHKPICLLMASRVPRWNPG